jgi:hypothetical protein
MELQFGMEEEDSCSYQIAIGSNGIAIGDGWF